MSETTVLTAELIEQMLRQLKGFPDATVFVNVRDWLKTRREFRHGGIRVKRYNRTSTFEIYNGLRHVADLCVDLNNRFPLPEGKLFVHWKKPFELKIENRYESPLDPWRAKWRWRL